MKLTTARLKKLIREELERLNERSSNLMNFSRPGTFSWKPERLATTGAMADVEVSGNTITWSIRLMDKNGEYSKNPLLTVRAFKEDLQGFDVNKAGQFLDEYVSKYLQYNIENMKSDRKFDPTQKGMSQKYDVSPEEIAKFKK